MSNIYALKKLGAKVMVCGPTTLIPKFIHKLGVEVEHDLLKALQWCDVANMLRIQLERQDIQYFPTIREYVKQFGLNHEVINSLNKKITILHPGPINRGVEITSEVANSPNSIILKKSFHEGFKPSPSNQNIAPGLIHVHHVFWRSCPAECA